MHQLTVAAGCNTTSADVRCDVLPVAALRRSLYNAALICRLVLTWFPNPPAQLVGPLSTVTDP